jgi:hypothetical protein
MKISELLDGIKSKDLVLPEFQREYVWSKDQAKQFLVSLFKEYPVGGLLFWKTENPPELKNVQALPDRLGTVQVILDGQQRLTTLFLLLRGEIPPYYRESDIAHDARDLYFNLETRDFQYYSPLKMKDNPLWVRVVDCFDAQKVKVFDVVKKVAKEGQDPFTLAQVYNDNLTQLRNIEKATLPAQTVPVHAALEDAITIFDLVNSQGTKLTDAELALTHISGKWAQARRIFKKKIGEMDQSHFYFDLTFLTRSLTGVVCQRALYETIHTQPKPKLQAGWQQLDQILVYLADILSGRAYIDSTRDLATNNALVPLVVYLSQNTGRFPDETAIKHAIHWLYMALTWSRYSSQTDQKLEKDVSIVVRETIPWTSLCDQIIDQRGRVDVKASDFEGRGLMHPLYNLVFIVAKAFGAVDWNTGTSLRMAVGINYSLQNAYIFPQTLLYQNGYDSENHLHRKIVSEIANRVVLKNAHPYPNLPPEEYFPLIEEKFPGALAKQFVPMQPELWKLNNFDDFLQTRRELMTRRINDFLKTLIDQPVIVHKRPISELIHLGESDTLEFKSTIQWDIRQEQHNTNLRHEILKTIVAFLNSGGGTLVIGVEDNGNVYGLEKDLKVVGGTEDGIQKLLSSMVLDRIGPEFSPFIKLRFEQINGASVCVVDVDRSNEPAYVKAAQGPEFFIRFAATSKKLEVDQAVEYVNANW